MRSHPYPHDAIPHPDDKVGRPAHACRYGLVAITLHWIMAALIFALFGIGWYMGTLPEGPERSAYIALHKSLGLTVAALLVLRLVWRLLHRPPALPGFLPAWERRAALLNHRLLYLLMFVQPVTGYLSSSFSGYKTRYFGIPLPHWGWEDETLNTIFNTIHVVNAYILFGLIGLHVLAALRHLLIERDGIFQRMWP